MCVPVYYSLTYLSRVGSKQTEVSGSMSGVMDESGAPVEKDRVGGGLIVINIP